MPCTKNSEKVKRQAPPPSPFDALASGDEVGKRIVAKFDAMKKAGTLPKQLDPNHKIAKFYGDDFAKSRYTY
ncbi:MAG: hypothetical protein IKB75_06620 [Clostridia bacterium]|nr:hypothetical protein [Clostridia bacterium]